MQPHIIRIQRYLVNPSTLTGLKAGACSGLTLSGVFCLRPKGRGVGAVEWVKLLYGKQGG